jgi:hypothetical protein
MRWGPSVHLFLASLILTACQTSSMVPDDPACPNVRGTYERIGEPLPGMLNYFRKVTVPLTLDRMLGIGPSSEEEAQPAEVRVFQDETIELDGPATGGPSSRLELLPGDSVTCSQGEMRIRQLRHTRGYTDEQQWRITKTTRYLNLDPDGTLVVKTTIRPESKSSLLKAEEPLEVYGARFKRRN